MQRSVIVVGGAGGVGLALVKQLLALGYRVSVSVLDDREADLVKAEAPGVENVLRVDLSDGDSVAPALADYFGKVEDLAGIFVCAAVSPICALELAPLSTLRRTFEINAVSGVAIFQAGIEALRRSRGRYLTIISMAGKLTMPLLGHYSASKYALESLVDAMRMEAAPFGVEVIAFEPGGIRTPMVVNQKISLERDIANLSERDRALYGDLYDRFAGLSANASAAGMPPEDVADCMVKAFVAEKPERRYEVGEDAKQLLAMKRELSDREFDKLIDGFMASAHPAENA